MTKRFTDRYVRTLKPQDKRYMVSEPNAHGQGTLAVRVTPSGTRSFVYVYKHGGRTRFMTLGTYPEMSVAQAHEAFGRANAQREQGFDPAVPLVAARAEARRAPTVAQLVELYLEEWAKPRKKSWRRDEALLGAKVSPRWGSRIAATITRRDVRDLNMAVIRGHGETTANRTFEIVRKMFNWAVKQEILEHSPCVGVDRPAKDKSRERVLTSGELERVLAGLPDARMELAPKLALCLLLLTAQRSHEVLGAPWDEFDLEHALWTIPGARTKNGETQPLPLSGAALRVLAMAGRLGGERVVFPSVRGDTAMGETSLSLAVRRNLDGFGVSGWTPHDLRRTAASHMAELGVQRIVIARILNHKDSAVTAVYERYLYRKEKLAALELWSEKLGELGLGAVLDEIEGQVERRVGSGWWRRRKSRPDDHDDIGSGSDDG